MAARRQQQLVFIRAALLRDTAAEGHNLALLLPEARGEELGWLDLWWGHCVPGVTSGTAAVAASAGDVCWGEEFRLPEGKNYTDHL